MAEAWTETENIVVVRHYLDMLEQELTNQSYVKRRFNEAVAEETGRSTGSVEYKFQNVSAALRDLNALYVDGYVPARNYQKSLATAVREALAQRPAILELMRTSVAAPAVPRTDWAWNVVEPPGFNEMQAQRGVEGGLHTDFIRLEADNRQLGLNGERLVVELEKKRLRDAGRPDLAERVEHVSQVCGDGLGYDVRSFSPDERPRLIEVKTTRRGIAWPMLVSANEVEVSRREPEHYVVARVFDFASEKVGLYELAGAIPETCILEPDTYRALPRAV